MRDLRPCAVIGEIAVLVSLLSSMACSSETSEPSPTGSRTVTATTSEIDELCHAECTRSAKCNTVQTPDEQAPTCPARCEGKLGNLATAVRGDVARYLARCYDALPCGMNDDRCLGEAIIATGEPLDAALHAPDVSSCLQKEMECHGTSGAFSDDEC